MDAKTIPQFILLLAIGCVLGVSAFAEDQVATVKADALRVRAEPSLDAAILTKIPMGAQVHILESPKESAPWIKIRIPGQEQTGWVHGDYLTFDNAIIGRLQFVRVTRWPADPRLQTPPPGANPFYGVHGTFNPGAQFTILAQDSPQTYPATAQQTFQLEYVDSPITITEITFAPDHTPQKEPFLAIIGNPVDYIPIPLTAISDPNRTKELTQRVATEAPDFKPLPYDYPDSGYDPHETKPYPFSLEINGAPAFLVTYKTPFRTSGSPQNIDGYCTSALLLWKGKPFNCSTDYGQGIQFFQINQRDYAWINYESGDNGIRHIDVILLDSGKAQSLYTNNDFAT